MKKIFTVISCFVLAAVMFVCGCAADGRNGRDGRDGQDVSIEEIYEKYVEEYGEISYADFLKEYLSYSNDEIDRVASLQYVINRSLMSSVTILTRFAYTSNGSSAPGKLGDLFSNTTYSVYTGTGVILWLDKDAGDAYVVTNCHVVYDDTSDNNYAENIYLYLYGQDVAGYNFNLDNNNNIVDDENYRIEAEIVGASVTYDIALLKVSGSEVLKRSDAQTASFSESEDVYVGEYVYAVGNAAGESLAASEGIISKDSEFIELSLSDADSSDTGSYRVIRTTAAINHGNSGGGLFNSEGKIVGIVNSKDDGADTDNMGYALPANSVRRLLALMYDSYISNGKFVSGVDKALININYSVTDSYATFNSLTGLAEITEIIEVETINGSPARGNLQEGDEIKNIKILSSDGSVKEEMAVTRRYHITDLLFSVRKGDTVILTVLRDGEEKEVSINFDSDKYFYHYA